MVQLSCVNWRLGLTLSQKHAAAIKVPTATLQLNINHQTAEVIVTRGQSNLTKSASRGAHSPVRGHPRGSKVVPLNSWGRVSY